MTEREIATAMDEGQPYVEAYWREAGEASDGGLHVLTRYLERIWKEYYFVLTVHDAEGNVVAYSHSREPDAQAEDEFHSDFIGRRERRPEGDLD